MYLATALAKILEDDKSIKCIASFNDIMSPTYILFMLALHVRLRASRAALFWANCTLTTLHCSKV